MLDLPSLRRQVLKQPWRPYEDIKYDPAPVATLKCFHILCSLKRFRENTMSASVCLCHIHSCRHFHVHLSFPFPAYHCLTIIVYLSILVVYILQLLLIELHGQYQMSFVCGNLFNSFVSPSKSWLWCLSVRFLNWLVSRHPNEILFHTMYENKGNNNGKDLLCVNRVLHI